MRTIPNKKVLNRNKYIYTEIKPLLVPNHINAFPLKKKKQKQKQTNKRQCCILVSALSCPALTVGRLVKTSPNTCVTSQTKINTKCSFSCPQRYQLQGPSYKQCGSYGQWTDSAKSVSCTGEPSDFYRCHLDFLLIFFNQIMNINLILSVLKNLCPEMP